MSQRTATAVLMGFAGFHWACLFNHSAVPAVTGVPRSQAQAKKKAARSRGVPPETCRPKNDVAFRKITTTVGQTRFQILRI